MLLTARGHRGVVGPMAVPKAPATIRVKRGELRLSNLAHMNGAVVWFVDGEEGAFVGECKLRDEKSLREAMGRAIEKGNAHEAAYMVVELAAVILARGSDRKGVEAYRTESGVWIWYNQGKAVPRLMDRANAILASIGR